MTEAEQVAETLERAPRVGLVGAARRRQGLGPYVARDLEAAGAEVVSFCTARPETVAGAAEQLAAQGIAAEGHGSLASLLRQGPELDALAILSPLEHHEAALALALEHGLHVLCEKPLLGGPWPSEPRVRATVEAFAEGGLLLQENTQWPCTLSTARQWTTEPAVPPKQFRMQLAPEAAGWTGALDSLSHPLSLLRALLEGPLTARDVRVETDPSSSRVHFVLDHGAGTTRCEVELLQTVERPRPAGFGWDGLWFERRISAADYAMSLVHEGVEAQLPDPLTAHVGAFVDRLRATLSGTRPAPALDLTERARLLDTLLAAFPTP